MTETCASTQLVRARQWLSRLDARDGATMRSLRDTYAGDSAVADHKRERLLELLRAYVDRHGDEPVVLSRAPGRVNLMGRHVDHQGGRCNMIALDRDVWVVAGARSDREVRASNLEVGRFPERCFHLDELASQRSAADWRSFVDSDHVRAVVAHAGGDWSQYVKAPFVRLLCRDPGAAITGMNVVVGGDLPMAAGLSSSSAIVVAMMQAVLAIAGMRHSATEFVDLCGEAEWFVGTRGGSGDHAAMKLARPGEVVQLDFLPLACAGSVPFPAGHVLLVSDSHEKARKTEGARATFNHRVACYHLGRELLKREFPAHAAAVQHLRDVNERALTIGAADVLRMVARLPERASADHLRQCVPSETADRWLPGTGEVSPEYPIRAVVLFGLAECERSRSCADLLRRGENQRFGRLMNISHDGDRVSRWDGEWSQPFRLDHSEAGIQALIDHAESGDSAADLAWQPGGYACSTPSIDRMVDTALSVDGVVGAQLSGAGLGGCMMTLVREESCPALERALIEGYYEPLDLDPAMFSCRPVAGSGLLAA